VTKIVRAYNEKDRRLLSPSDGGMGR
jgi:hypothetical protein